MGAEVPTSALIGAIATLASAIAFLFFYFDKKLTSERAENAKSVAVRESERVAWGIERAKLEADKELLSESLRADYEAKFHELLERYDEISARERESNRAHEDSQRKEFAEVMETVASKAAEASAATVQMLDKLMDRFVSQRARR